MNWFIYAVICILGWGFADMFYKMGTDEADKFSHLKIAIWVGIVMGVVSAALLIFSGTTMTLSAFVHNTVSYLPASLSYIISMIIGYAGLRYLELSIISPVQNASGALAMVCMLVILASTGRIGEIGTEFSTLDIAGTVFVIAGVIALAIVEQIISDRENADVCEKNGKKYRMGALAFVFPILYCVFDTIGTAADGMILDGAMGIEMSEIEVLIIYGLTFFAVGIICYIFLKIKSGKFYNPFAKNEWPKAAAACCEEFGQVFYIYAMAARPVIAAPMVASYCVVSILLSRILLKERVGAARYVCIGAVVAGILCLGISEGLAG